MEGSKKFRKLVHVDCERPLIWIILNIKDHCALHCLVGVCALKEGAAGSIFGPSMYVTLVELQTSFGTDLCATFSRFSMLRW